MSTERVRILVFDDGTPGALDAARRAVLVADELLIAEAHGSPNGEELQRIADAADTPAETSELGRHEGIRHALALCAEHSLCIAYVPAPDAHPGEMLRKSVQAVGRAGDGAMPALAVRFVRPETASGPVVEVTPEATDAGFTTLFAIGLAISDDVPLHIIRLASGELEPEETEVRAATALDEARLLIAQDIVPVLDERSVTSDPVPALVAEAAQSSAVVVGLGGLEIRGRKLTAPDELPDAVLETEQGELVHGLLREAPCDVVVVIDAISLHTGVLPAASAATTVAAAVGAGAVASPAAGLAVVTAGLALTAATYVAPSSAEPTDDA